MKTKELTTKQREFVKNKAAGVANKEAAIAAGYSAASADVQAANMLARPHIKAAIKAAQQGVEVRKGSGLRARYESPRDLMEDVMNNAHFPDALRIAAAKDLLPYFHAKMGEIGKKEKAKDTAHGAVTRRAPLGVPGLKIVK
jgi:phage terminase small subunit